MKKIPLWKNVILILSALFVIMIATFAWFIFERKTNTNTLPVRVGRATYIQISGGGGGLWKEDLSLPISLDRKFKEISGNGAELYAPVYVDAETAPGSGVYAKMIQSFQPVDTDCYYEQELSFRSNETQEVYLSPESYARAWEPLEGYRIDGAVRVAFFEIGKDGKETLSYIWAPNSKIEYSAETYSYKEDGSVEPYYYYQTSPVFEDTRLLSKSTPNVAVISTENTDVYGCGYSDGFMWTNGSHMPENAPYVVKFEKEDQAEDGIYYKKIKVMVWVEGHDRECVNLLSGEKFIVMLKFITPEGEEYE